MHSTKTKQISENKKTKINGKTKKRMGNIAVLLIAGFMAFRGLMQIPRINERKEELENLRQEKIYEEARAEEVEEMKTITDTDEYIEKMAREKLGLVREDEKIFIDVSKQDN